MLGWLVFGSLTFFLGGLAGAFGIVACMLVLFFSIPTTSRLKREGLFPTWKPLFQDAGQFLGPAAIFVVISWAAGGGWANT